MFISSQDPPFHEDLDGRWPSTRVDTVCARAALLFLNVHLFKHVPNASIIVSILARMRTGLEALNDQSLPLPFDPEDYDSVVVRQKTLWVLAVGAVVSYAGHVASRGWFMGRFAEACDELELRSEIDVKHLLKEILWWGDEREGEKRFWMDVSLWRSRVVELH